jgi:xylanolytic transcriptional activator XlnR
MNVPNPSFHIHSNYLSRILSDILEYHYLCQHPALGSNTELLKSLRAAVEQNMEKYDKSVRELQERASLAARASDVSPGVSIMVWDAGQLRDPNDVNEEFPLEPRLLLYAWHMLHCMYTILYGKLDPVDIFQDTEWLLSNDFLIAAEHADKCTKVGPCSSLISLYNFSLITPPIPNQVTSQILRLDPKLHEFYRMFGTYFLHSSFIFLILARKLRHSADEYILNSCRTYLRTLEAFAATVNIRYQKTFARVLQDTIAKCVEAQKNQLGNSEATAPPVDDWLDPAILNYRWTVGHSGLWNGEMGRQLEMKK